MILIHNVRLVTPDAVLDDAWILVEGDSIQQTGQGQAPSAQQTIDGQGSWAMAGFIDLHSDALEGETQPRPGVFLAPELGFFSLESKLVCHGITTMFHSLSFHDNRISMRNSKMVEEVIRGINRLQGEAIIRHKVHTRFEISEVAAEPVISQLISEGLVQLVSLMNHCPGQGQYCDLDKYRANLAKNRGLGPAEADLWISERQARMTHPDIPATMQRLADTARAAGIPLASHDDDSPGKVLAMRDLGVDISEFPINLHTAIQARQAGMHIVMGAPNIVRGASNSGNMRAIDAIMADAADILCSDYVPPAILHAVFKLHHEYNMPLPQASAMASLNPALAVGLGDVLGSLESGKLADIILVDTVSGIPQVNMVMSNGAVVLTKGRRLPMLEKELVYAR